MNLLVIIVSFIYYSHDCYQWIWNMDYCITDRIMELWIVFSFHDSNDNCFFTSDDSSEIDFKSFYSYHDWSLLFHSLILNTLHSIWFNITRNLSLWNSNNTCEITFNSINKQIMNIFLHSIDISILYKLENVQNVHISHPIPLKTY